MWSPCSTSKLPPQLQARRQARDGQGLTGNVVIVVLLELQAHVVGAELLELDGEADFLLGPIAGNQHVGVKHGAAGSCLLRPHQVQLVVLVGPPCFCSGTDDVQLVSNLWVDDQALPTQEPAQKGSEGQPRSWDPRPCPQPGEQTMRAGLGLQSGDGKNRNSILPLSLSWGWGDRSTLPAGCGRGGPWARLPGFDCSAGWGTP